MLGPSASQRLKAMIADPKLVDLQVALDRALAVSFGVTSYISSVRKYGPGAGCTRRADSGLRTRRFFPATTGRRAGRNSRSRADGGGQKREDFHRGVWSIPREGQSAVGYLFEVHGRWSEPEQVLEGPSRYSRDYGNAPLLADDFSLVTKFNTSSGEDCGTYSVSFHLIHAPQDHYQVNNANLEGLIRLINSCFVQ